MKCPVCKKEHVRMNLDDIRKQLGIDPKKGQCSNCPKASRLTEGPTKGWLFCEYYQKLCKYVARNCRQ